ncbi:ISAs1 family transposase [Gloeobacter morelensis MG652769]|uniref:ISAs1 family transposase n=1 Tax=Gloeobacter morelensis MG652769 TaxID=2781736 RepID=A0ABY3PU76_9CYAN|nr:ISAs1 family transposase [Gloeobacter morelensis]UFP97079.1 ISAs1 family transposase [Gloeobacter morelensis MG652769]
MPRPTASAAALSRHLLGFFCNIPDPRVERIRAHHLTDILMIAILAVIAGARGWEDIENYGDSKQHWLAQFLELPGGIPCADTFRRTFERIDPVAFEQSFRAWVQTLVCSLGAQVIAIDGKTLKGSYERGTKTAALQMVSAWASEHRLTLGQLKVSDKSNEITAIPALLEVLEVCGCIVTIDAMGTQTEIAGCIRKAKADYVLALKANHPTLYQQVKDWFAQAQAQQFVDIAHSYDQRVEAGHHRLERRQVWSVPVSALPKLHGAADWQDLKSVVMVVRERRLWNKTTREVQFYLSSLLSEARVLGQAIRRHWGIENALHWRLDVSFGEDACRIRTGHAPQNLSLLRRLALNALGQEQSCRRSTRQKSNRAAMDDNYMLTVLIACLPEAGSKNEPVCQ